MTSSDDETGKEANSFHLSRLEHTAQALYFRCSWKFEVNERDGNFANYGAALVQPERGRQYGPIKESLCSEPTYAVSFHTYKKSASLAVATLRLPL